MSNLDAALRVQMRVELAKLHDQLNATMIYVTHDQTEAMTLANDIVVLDEGVVSQKEHLWNYIIILKIFCCRFYWITKNEFY